MDDISPPPPPTSAGGLLAMKRALGLRGRLLLLMAAAFAALAGFVAWDFVGHREELINDASKHLLHNAQVIAARQQSVAAQADAILTGLMLLPELRPGAPAEACSQLLAARLAQEKEFIQIGRTLPDGEVACAAVPPKDRVSFADRDYFQQALRSREMVVSDVVVGRILNQPIIVFAKAMHDEAGRVSAVFYLSLNLEWLRRDMVTTRLPEGGRLVVVDARGIVAVRHPDPESLTGRSIAHLPLFQRIQAAGVEGTTEDIGLDGVRKIYGFTPLLQTVSGPIYLWLSEPKAMVEAPARRHLLVSLAFELAVLAAAFGLVVLGGNRLVLRPLRILSRTTVQLKAGNLGARTGLPHGDDEFGRLARTLDEASAAIESGERKLALANRALRVLSAGNRAMLHTRGEQELVAEMCRAIVEAGGYRIAWAGYAVQDPARSVRTVAAWGAERDFLDSAGITWGETASGRGPTGTAIRLGIPVVSNDIAADPDYAPWRELALRHGIASSLSLPLRLDGAVIGALCICAAEPGVFGEDVVELLGGAADDLAFGIATQRMQAALQTAEERFRAAADASLDALFILKCVRNERGEILDFEFTDLNPRAERMLGMARGQVVGQKLCELLPFYRTGGFFDKYAAVATSGAPLEEEFPIDTPEIRAKWLRQQIVRVDEGIAISSRDITAWKEASAAVRRLQEQNTLILNSAGEGLFGLDLEGRATFINPAAVAMLQWMPEEVAGQTMHALHHHTRADGTPYPREACPIHAAYRDGVAHRVEDEVFWRRDGTSFPVEYASTPIRDAQGRLLGAVVSFDDISERKAAEKALARAVRALKTLSTANEALVRAASEEELLQAAVRIIVEQGGYRLAAIGFAGDDPEKSITPVAWAGAEEGYYSQQRPTWADTDKGQVPIARAIRSGTPQICRDIAGDAGFAPWRESALARGYASNLALPLCDGARTFGGLSIYSAEKDAFDEEEARLLGELGNDLAYGIVTLRTRAERDRLTYAHVHHAEILQKSLEQSIQAIAGTVEARDPYTAGHQRRVGELAAAIARELGLPEEKIRGIRLAATIHDLGKIHIPAEILSKPGKLGDIEFMLIKAHPQAGYDILKDIDFPWPIADMVRQHHEKLDGSGYPQGLKDGEIRLESRIMTVADVVEAMSSHRPYRPALGIEAALKEIERGSGSAYDEAAADACLKLFREGKFTFQG